MRAIAFEDFPSFAVLDELQLLGNACRHGDGASALELSRRCPELWNRTEPLPDGLKLPPLPPLVAYMNVPVGRLEAFARSIAEFWNDAKYIYNEIIDMKAENLQRRLAEERKDRKWLPQRSVDG